MTKRPKSNKVYLLCDQTFEMNKEDKPVLSVYYKDIHEISFRKSIRFLGIPSSCIIFFRGFSVQLRSTDFLSSADSENPKTSYRQFVLSLIEKVKIFNPRLKLSGRF